MLSAHTDVVPVEGQPWTGDPVRAARGRRQALRPRRLRHEGLRRLRAGDGAAVPAKAGLRKPIHLLLSYDEETTCLGSLDFIRRFGVDLPRPAAVIVGEPTLGQVADAHKGVATFRTVVRGVEAHSAHPALGANAISAAAEIVAEIDRLAREEEAQARPRRALRSGLRDLSRRHDPRRHGAQHPRPRLPRRLGISRPAAHGGEPTRWRGCRRFVDDVALPRLRRHTPEPTIETTMDVDVPGSAAEPGSSAATLALRLAHANATIAVSYATESGHFQRAGLPTVVCGPGSIEQAHKPDEYIAVAELTRCLAFLGRSRAGNSSARRRFLTDCGEFSL